MFLRRGRLDYCYVAKGELMAANRGHFDCEAFYAALDDIRKAKDLSWKKMADQSKVSASTLTRMGQGKHPDADSLTMLSAWAGLNPADFATDESIRARETESLPKMMALLRADPNLSNEAVQAIQDVLTVAYRRLGKSALEGTDGGDKAAPRI
jgi:transcriptional regulator with XRE-family HTH domain